MDPSISVKELKEFLEKDALAPGTLWADAIDDTPVMTGTLQSSEKSFRTRRYGQRRKRRQKRRPDDKSWRHSISSHHHATRIAESSAKRNIPGEVPKEVSKDTKHKETVHYLYHTFPTDSVPVDKGMLEEMYTRVNTRDMELRVNLPSISQLTTPTISVAKGKILDHHSLPTFLQARTELSDDEL
jgi:hypothetical protein